MSSYVFQAQLGVAGKYGYASFEPSDGINPESIPAMLNAGTAWLEEDAIIGDYGLIAEVHDSWTDERRPSGEIWRLHPDDVRYLSERK